ncbi:MAG TPA: DUF3857 domain-containing protein [Povalibacter sp.]|uniref:DUF3857 domain-containing protein n=1 Tax=Povalibacter sp. TaxID=1962978 RepID=UPI002B540F7A|nr:DUF3857 domain-containing protein [Povalibacter sp.]HMN44408.1 DUF3857 domain-containing protein [Povalibacter sp.]
MEQVRAARSRARSCTACVVLFMSMLVSAPTRGDDSVVLSGSIPSAEIPDWINRIESGTPGPGSGQVEYLLVDRQVRVSEAGSSSYVHLVMHLATQAAVDEQAHVQISYRPPTERIVLHQLRLRRGSQIIDQRQRARMSTLRRELELERGILDGELTASVLLEDVRVGDVLEYSYTLERGDDGLGTAYSDRYTTQWSNPVRHSYLRVLHPESRHIVVKDLNPSEQPVVRNVAGTKERVWQWHGLAGIAAEEDVPGWVTRYPAVLLSEYPDWRSVSRWARRLYPDVALSPQMRELVAQWRSDARSTDELILRALRFVQDEIRYTGIEIGPGGYKPQSPDIVLKRRFGDCKEKAYLLVTLLRGMGVKAQPALVNTVRKEGVRVWLPAPSAFDHVIVRVAHEGRIYWVDATASLQGGSLATIVQAQFGNALVIADAGEFETIPRVALNGPGEEVVERYDLTAGAFARAAMEVSSTYSGAAADRMRRRLASRNLEEVGRDYLNYYKEELPTISAAGAVRVEDDRYNNRLVVKESYELDPAFTRNEGDDRHYFEFSAHVIRGAARAPKTLVRKFPLQLDHPTHVVYRAEIRLPEPWNIETFDKAIAGPGFDYRSSVRYRQQTITTEYEFRTLATHIAAADVQEYSRKLEAVREDASYYLSHTGDVAEQPFRLAFSAVFAIVCGIAGGALLIRWLFRYRNPDFPAPAGPLAPTGLTGWMLLPALGTVISPFACGYVLYSCQDYFDAGIWTNLGAGQDVVLAHWGRIGIFFVIALASALLLLSTFLNYLLFRKHRAYPAGYIATSWIGVLLGLLAMAALFALGAVEEKEQISSIAEIVRDSFSAVIWTCYMVQSQRVRATFVNDGRA